MPKKPGANLYKGAAAWPVIPPWWLLSSPQAAALVNVEPATLHYWRTRGEGPAAVAPLFLKPAQGDPVFYVYGTLRSWAAERVGVQYLFEDQCYDFFRERAPWLVNGTGSLAARASTFDSVFEKGRRSIGLGTEPKLFPTSYIIDLDGFYSKQPRWIRPTAKYDWVIAQAAEAEIV